MKSPLPLAALLIASPALAGPTQDWPQWRGPAGDGIAPEQAAPLSWDRETNVRWRTPLAQPGNGSPVVSAGKVFLCMAEDDQGKGRSLLCLDADGGEELWRRTVDFGHAMPTHPSNPHCSTTPASNGERVVVWHASAGLHCYDLEGELLWSRELGEFRHMWGHGTSPVLFEDSVLLQSGPGERSFVAAFELESGATRWEVEEPVEPREQQGEDERLVGSWCTPLITRVGERALALSAQPTRLVAYDARTGEEAFWCEGLVASRGDLSYSSPVVADGVCLVQGGYVGPSIGLRLGGEGDVTGSRRIWHHPELMSNCGSGVFAGGAVFIPDMDGFLYCIEPKSGEALWRRRISRGGTWGSVVSAGGRLYLMNQKGTTYVFAPRSEELELLAENPLGETTNATPAVAGGRIFLRTHEAIYCIADAD